jgi:hypothetical protein
VKSLIAASVFVLTLIGPALRAQDGLGVRTAIPIYFGQVTQDTIDSTTRPQQIYKISLARGQQFTATATISATRPAAQLFIALFAPSTVSITACDARGMLTSGGAFLSGATTRVATLSYEVAAAGDYLLQVCTYASPGVQFQLQVNSVGTPIVVPNPVQAGCLLGRVDYMTYSLQLVAAGLPDEVSIGGVKACTTCQVKAPKYPELASRIENALRSKVNVEACHDGGGDIFQLKLVQP